jgi:hypothetical protein
MPVSNSNREPSTSPSHSGGGSGGGGRRSTDCGDQPAPRFTHIQSDGQLEVPHDCDASVFLKLVDSVNRIYAIWLVVGRYGDGAMTASYKAATGDIRADIPSGATMSSAVLQDHLTAFVNTGVLSPLEGKPTTVVP